MNVYLVSGFVLLLLGLLSGEATLKGLMNYRKVTQKHYI